MSFGPNYTININFPQGINIYHLPASSDRDLAGLLKQILDQLQEQKQMATALDEKIAALQAAVAKETSVEQSAITLIQGFPALIADAVAKAQAAGATADQLQAITDVQANVTASADALAAAVSANTPAATPAA